MRTVEIDGEEGEGGGQTLRSALALSIVTQQAFRMRNIRAKRPKPGLAKQHLACIEAAAAISSARAAGAELGSGDLEFAPGPVRHGDYCFSVGSAGSAPLVLQTVLPPLLVCSGRSSLILEGGTHNAWAPPFDFLAGSFAPWIRRFGAEFDLSLQRCGFHPAGGGRFTASLQSGGRLARLDVGEPGRILRRRARALVAAIPDSVGHRELSMVRERLGWTAEECGLEKAPGSPGPGNALVLELEAEHVTAVFSSIGRRGVSAENVAADAVKAASCWMDACVTADEHLADQLLIPLALSGGGSFTTTQPSLHSLTNAALIEKFLPVKITFQCTRGNSWLAACES